MAILLVPGSSPHPADKQTSLRIGTSDDELYELNPEIQERRRSLVVRQR